MAINYGIKRKIGYQIKIDLTLFKFQIIQIMSNYNIYGTDQQNYNFYDNKFDDRDVRRGFIRKVYSLLTLQILFTCGLSSLFIIDDNAKQFLTSHEGIILTWMSMIGLFVLMISMICCHQIARKFPQNYGFLFLFTILMSYIVSGVTCQYQTNNILIAFGATASVTLGLTLYSFQTKYDFTGWGMGLTGFLFLLIFSSLILGFTNSNVLNLAYSIGGALLFSLFIIYDTQLIIGGKHKKYQFSPDDYVFAAISLYIDIINMFLFILGMTERD